MPLVTIGILIVAAITGGIFVMQRPDVFISYIKDDFAKDCLKATVYWTRNDIIYGIVYLACIITSIFMMQTKHVKWGAYLLIISSGLFVSTVMTFVVPRIEKYSQAGLIEFLESKKNERCTIETAGFKSYAHYFYAAKPIPAPDDSLNKTYIITKSNKVEKVRTWYSEGALQELYRKNGWVFFEKVK